MSKPSLPIAPEDSLRVPDAMEEPDRTGIEGRWLDVPRLPQFNGLTQSWLWCGRTSAAMIYDYYCKALDKTSEYVGHKTGKPGVGSNGKLADNLRWMGGSHADEIAAIGPTGKCDLSQLFDTVGWKLQEGYLQKSASESVGQDKASVEKCFAPVVEALQANNPVLIYTRLSTSKNGRHIVVISGWKKQDGDLWLRINDPANPQPTLLQKRNLQLIQKKPDSFSEYWVRATKLLDPHPRVQGKRLLSYMEIDKLGRYFFVLDQKVDDAKEVVHRLDRSGASGGRKEEKKAGDGPKPAVPPAAGGTCLPFEVNKSQQVSAEALESLYHLSERSQQGFFPLGAAGVFHCGTDLVTERGKNVCAMARGELVAARIGVGPGEHPWGDTGFVLLRHPLQGDKTIYCLYLHVAREVLHPDRTKAGWLRRLLTGGGAKGKAKWRVTAGVPTWKDEDKGKFSPVNVQHEKLLDPGVYEEEERAGEDNGLYVKLKGSWVKVAQDGSALVKELSPWADFDFEAAAKANPVIGDLRDGKVALFDADKKDGKRKWTVETGEPVGTTGAYLGMPAVHWSVFSKDSVFPTGLLPGKEYGEKDEVKLADLDLSEERGDFKHTKKLMDALDPDKKFIANVPQGFPTGGEIQLFYRTPFECWRSRYQAVKGLAEFMLDVDKFVAQERYKSHTDAEREEFKKNARIFLFWKYLAKAEDFPADGKAVFVHPVTALRLMAHVALPRDTDGEKELTSDDRLHPHDDVTLLLRDTKGPVAEAKVEIKVDGEVVHSGTTDAAGALLIPIEAVQDREIEVAVDQSAVGDKGKVAAVVNETNAPGTLMPGDAPGKQTINGTDLVPDPRLGLPMRIKKGAKPDLFKKWDERSFTPAEKIKTLHEGDPILVERMVFRRDNGKYEAVQAFSGDKLGYLWSIYEGEENADAEPAAHQKAEGDEKRILATWSQRTAHVNDHPVLAGRVFNIDEGAELEVTFCAILGQGAPEHDEELHLEKIKVAKGGFSVAFDPHALIADHDLLSQARPVFARVKVGDKLISLRDQACTIYDETKVQEHPPAPPENTQKAPREIAGYSEIVRSGESDRFTTKDGKEPKTRKLSQLSGQAAARFAADGSDEVYIGGCVGEMHLATEDQADLTAAAAMTQQKERGKALYPDMPDWIFAKPEEAYFRDNGMTVGICAQDCKKEVCKEGKKTGCTEEIRRSNLLSCQHAKNDLCKKAVKLPIVDGKIETQSCYSALGICRSVGHDKTRCFLQTVVRGPESEERERWYVSIPMMQARKAGKDGHLPYHRRSDGKNLRVVLVNPRNGAAVVCSMEDYGPSGKSKEGNAAIAEASVEKDELVGMGHICGMSYEARWKLELHNVHGEPVVLLAFVPSTTPLGPLPEGTVIKLRKSIKREELLGI